LLPAEVAAETPSNEPTMVTAPPISRQLPGRDRLRSRYGVAALLGTALAVGMWSVGRTALHSSDDNSVAQGPLPRMEVIRPGSLPPGTGAEPTVALTQENPNPDARLAMFNDPKPAAPKERPVVTREELAAPARGMDDDLGADDSQGQAPQPERREEARREGAKPAVGASKAFPVEDTHGDRVAARAWQESQPPPEPAEPPRGGGAPALENAHFEQLVVQDGDSLSGIARRIYGQSSYTVLDLLKLANPEVTDVDAIAPGQPVKLPELDGFPVLSDGGGRYALLVFSTPNQQRAQNLSKALRGRGFNGSVTPATLGAQKRVYRVTVGGLANHEDVNTVGRSLQRLFREDTRIAQLGE
jgi:hypothetical protein